MNAERVLCEHLQGGRKVAELATIEVPLDGVR